MASLRTIELLTFNTLQLNITLRGFQLLVQKKLFPSLSCYFFYSALQNPLFTIKYYEFELKISEKHTKDCQLHITEFNFSYSFPPRCCQIFNFSYVTYLNRFYTESGKSLRLDLDQIQSIRSESSRPEVFLKVTSTTKLFFVIKQCLMCN